MIDRYVWMFFLLSDGIYVAYCSGDALDYVEPCLPCASVSVETLADQRCRTRLLPENCHKEMVQAVLQQLRLGTSVLDLMGEADDSRQVLQEDIMLHVNLLLLLILLLLLLSALLLSWSQGAKASEVPTILFPSLGRFRVRRARPRVRSCELAFLLFHAAFHLAQVIAEADGACLTFAPWDFSTPWLVF